MEVSCCFIKLRGNRRRGRGAVFCAGMGRARMRVGGSTFAVAHGLPTCKPSRRCGRRRQSVRSAPVRSPRNRRIAGLRLRQSCDTAALVGRNCPNCLAFGVDEVGCCTRSAPCLPSFTPARPRSTARLSARSMAGRLSLLVRRTGYGGHGPWGRGWGGNAYSPPAHAYDQPRHLAPRK